MAVTLTGSKYSGSVSSYSSRQLVCTGVTFVTTDFDVGRIVAIYNSSNVFKGIAYVRGGINSTTIELEYDPFDPITNSTITVTGTDVFNVSYRLSELATTGLSVSGTEVIVSDQLFFGTAGNQRSLCLYDETKDVRQTAGADWQGLGGVVVFGHLLSNTSLSYNSPVNIVFTTGGIKFRTRDAAFHGFWMGGSLFAQVTTAFFGGHTGVGAGSLLLSGTTTSQIDLISVGAGGSWGANAARHVLRDVSAFASASNAIAVRWGDGFIDGGNFQLKGTGPISVFGADAAGTYSIGAIADSRLVVADTGIGNALWRSLLNPVQTINWTNVISANRTSTNTGGTMNFYFKDSYSGAVNGTKIVIKRNSGVVETSGLANGINPLELTIQRSTVVGTAAETIIESTWNWGSLAYDKQYVGGSFSLSTTDTIGGSADNVIHGARLAQLDDLSITQTNKTTVDAYIELETSSKFYDRAKAYLYDNYAGETATLVTRSGTTIDAGSRNITIDATAASVFAVDGSGNITIKATTFVGNITTTGTVTLSNGATVDGIVTDSTGTTGKLSLL